MFVYNRPEHTKKTIQALQSNILASDSDLYIYSDAARTTLDEKSVNEVRLLISNLSGFKSVKITLQDSNIGLAKSIINGVTETVNKYGKIIVLEDDIVTSEHFLNFMNDSLEMYQGNEYVHSISGCNYPVSLDMLEQDTYFLRVPLCWGWATWVEKWELFEKKPEEVSKTPKKLIEYINFDNTHDYFSQAIKNRNGKLNTWFIFWYIASAKKRMLTLFPKESLVENIGHDGSGENCGDSNRYDQFLCKDKVIVRDISLEESCYGVQQHKAYFTSLKQSIFIRVYSKIKRELNKYVN